MRCIEIDTPNSILEDEGRDIFAEIFADSTLTNGGVMQQALWAVYRYRMIGGCDIEQWLQAMKDRLSLVGPRWDAIISKAAETDLTDLSEVSYNRVIKREPIDGTDGDITTATGSGQDVTTTTSEDFPQTVAGSSTYISRRDTVNMSPSATRTSKYAPHTKDTEDYREERDLEAVTFGKMMASYPTILSGFARDFDAYFLAIL